MCSSLSSCAQGLCLAVGKVSRLALFEHPDEGDEDVIVRFNVQMPEGVKTLVGYTGIRDGAKITDGVDFEIRINGESVWQRNHDLPQWEKFDVDMTKYSGTTVVEFVTRKGKDNSSYDWACWGEPAILLGQSSNEAL